MPKLFVIAGHGAGDPGAGGHGYQEAERVRALAARMKELAPNDVELGDFNRNYYADKGISNLNLPKGTMVIELHMDSGPASAKGGHVIIKYGYTPDAFDSKLAENVSRMFPGRSNSIVGRSDLGNVNRAAAKGINYRLLENCFISNYDDITKFNADVDAVARNILDAAGIHVDTPQPEPEPETYVPRNVETKDYADDPAQHWFMRGELKHGNTIALRNRANWLWLSDPGSSQDAIQVQTWEGTGGNDGNADPRDPQWWIVEATNKPGVFKLHPKVAKHLSLDTAWNDPNANTQIQVFEDNKSEAQEFFFYLITGNMYRIVSCSGMKSLAVC